MSTQAPMMPGSLRWATLLLRGEAIALGLLALLLVYASLVLTTASLGSGLLLAALTAGVALLLWALAGALTRRRAGARAPAIVLQLLLLPVGYYMVAGELAWLGIPLAALGLLVCGLLLSPPTTRALGLG